jgi:hypothetical protein
MLQRKSLWIAIALLTVVAATVVVWRYLSAVSLDSPCAIMLVSEVSSANHKYVAAIFDRSCGATTPAYRIVSIRAEGVALSGDDASSWVFHSRGEPAVSVMWTGDKQVSVTYVPEPGIEPDRSARWHDVAVITTSKHR